jgi:hypothetical protein
MPPRGADPKAFRSAPVVKELRNGAQAWLGLRPALQVPSREDRRMSGITIRGAAAGAGVLGVATARELPFTGYVLTAYAVLAIALILTGLVARFAARGD